MHRTFTLIFLFVAQFAAADDLTIPNTFTAGTPARAAEVNGNFTAVEASVDDNAADIATNSASTVSNQSAIATNATDIQANSLSIQENALNVATLATSGGLPVFAQGIAVGRIISMPGFPGQAAWLISPTGYIFFADLAGPNASWLDNEDFFYSEINCAGDTFVSGISMLEANGAVYISTQLVNPRVVYVPAGSTRQSITTVSKDAGGNCQNIELTSDLYQAFPNNEAVTGVPDMAPVQPYKFGAP